MTITMGMSSVDLIRSSRTFFKMSFSRASPSMPSILWECLPESFIPIMVATKGNTSSVSSPHTRRMAVSSLLKASVCVTSSLILAHCLNRSMIGWKLRFFPMEIERPSRKLTLLITSRCLSSAISLDLPTPGSPKTLTTEPWPLTAFSIWSSSLASS